MQRVVNRNVVKCNVIKSICGQMQRGQTVPTHFVVITTVLLFISNSIYFRFMHQTSNASKTVPFPRTHRDIMETEQY